MDIGLSSIYGNWQGSPADGGFGGIYGRATGHSMDNKDATRMLGTHLV